MTHFNLRGDFIGTNVMTRKTAPWRSCFSRNRKHFRNSAKISFEQMILPKFREDWTVITERRTDNANSISLCIWWGITRFYYSHITKTASTLATMVFNRPELCSNSAQICEKCLTPWRPYIIRTNVLTTLVLTRKTASPPGDIISANVLTKFHEDSTTNVTS
ncbi:hypothetical protein DPMN_145087 [Dreissena polymorpha]|uniref:Uncharacterized protein n=1 Tax=Dreissena polymorpha TaxID=45954 RepID=A0A9D4J0P1_DREPO|nr:hypothetical protein DPMN_145087 [Dreissena polymorpha]